MHNTTENSRKNSITHITAMMIATALGSGFTPKAPGTAGTVVAVLIVLLWEQLCPGGTLAAAFWIFSAALFLAGWWASLRWSRHRAQTDNQEIVIDEVLGYFVALGCFERTTLTLFAAFLLFRIFDMWKPWPIRRMDRWGKSFPVGPAQSFMVIFDDLLAGAWALGILALAQRYFGPF